MTKFMVLIQPWAIYVKERSFFVAQGGSRERWGKHWRPVQARSIEAARSKGKLCKRLNTGAFGANARQSGIPEVVPFHAHSVKSGPVRNVSGRICCRGMRIFRSTSGGSQGVNHDIQNRPPLAESDSSDRSIPGRHWLHIHVSLVGFPE